MSAAPRGSLEASGRQGTGAGGRSPASLSDPRRDHQFSRRRHGPRRAPSSESLAKRDAAARPRRPSNQAQREALRSCLKGPLLAQGHVAHCPAPPWFLSIFLSSQSFIL